MKFNFLVSPVGEVFFFKNYHFTTGYQGQVIFFSLLPSVQQRSFFLTPQVSDFFFKHHRRPVGEGFSPPKEIFYAPLRISNGVPLTVGKTQIFCLIQLDVFVFVLYCIVFFFFFGIFFCFCFVLFFVFVLFCFSKKDENPPEF